jgi:hypothetical protein
VVIAFCGVVVDHIEDDLDTGLVKCANHGLELVDLLAALAGARVSVVRREEPDRVVAPVIAQATFQQEMVLDELMDWHELNCCHPERHQVIDHGGVRKACIGAAKIFRHTRVVLREALEVRFVDDGLVERRLRRAIASPVEEGVVHHGLGDVRCTVLKVGSELICKVV